MNGSYKQDNEGLKTYAQEDYTVAHGTSMCVPIHGLLFLLTHLTVKMDGVDPARVLSIEHY